MKAGVQILGISTDPVDSHKKFCESLKLPFPLLSDEGGKASKLYGILIETPQKDLLSGRSVFLVDRDGAVVYADASYDLGAADHDALLKAVKAAGERASRGEGKKEGKADTGKAGKPKTPSKD